MLHDFLAMYMLFVILMIVVLTKGRLAILRAIVPSSPFSGNLEHTKIVKLGHCTHRFLSANDIREKWKHQPKSSLLFQTALPEKKGRQEAN